MSLTILEDLAPWLPFRGDAAGSGPALPVLGHMQSPSPLLPKSVDVGLPIGDQRRRQQLPVHAL